MPEDVTLSSESGKLNLPGFPVVGICASSGGLSALLGLFDRLPVDTGMAFLLVLHVPAKDGDSVVAILSRGIGMPVVQLAGQVTLEPNRVYVVPHRHDLEMEVTTLHPVPTKSQRSKNTSIDHFFRSLADTYQSRAIGVVLSGTGSDGAVGLARIREQGGVAIAQSPGDADHEDMPRASIAAGSVDFILPVADIPARLISLWRNVQQICAAVRSDIASSGGVMLGSQDSLDAAIDRSVADSDSTRPGGVEVETEQTLRQIMELLRVRTRHDFRHYKRATLLRRIARRMQLHGQPDLAAYHDYLSNHVEETEPLLQDMLISVTNFFRDPIAMTSLERNVLPGMFKGRDANDQIRVWVVGCATGEEAYSVSIMLHELAATLAGTPSIQVFATDIDDKAIATARNGIYPGAIASDVSASRLREFFTTDDNSYRVGKLLRESVLFASHNVLHDAPFSRLDLVLCRNLLIYLDREAQTSILDIFHYALKPGGHLFLGTSETADSSPSAFTAVDARNRIYVANPRSVDQVGLGRMPTTAMRAPQAPQRPVSTYIAPRAPAPPTEQQPSAGSATALHQCLLLEIASASVLVGSDLKILHMTAGAGRFMVHRSGSPNPALMSNIHPDLRLELRAALMSAEESGELVEIRGIPVSWRQGSLQSQGAVNVRVLPRRDPDTNAALSLVLLEEAALATAATPADDTGEPTPQRKELAEENRRLKAQLRQVIALFDISNDELRASNTELATINDALRHATEELEIKKEELQSMNEELIAVNCELKAKVDESGQIEDDLKNLAAAGVINALFIDRGMSIKRFTPAAAELFDLRGPKPARSLADIAEQLDHTRLAEDVAESFQTLRPIERKVRSTNGRAYLARAHPYRTQRDIIEGAVLHLTDITSLQQAEVDLRSAEEILRLSAENSRNSAVLTLDQHGRIGRWDDDSERLFGYERQEMLGQTVESLTGPDDRTRSTPEEVLRNARERGRKPLEQTFRRKDGSTFQGQSILSALQDGPHKGFVQTIRDQSEVQQAQAVYAHLADREKSLTRELEKSRRSQDELFDALADALERPLNLIQVNADMLMKLPDTRDIPVVGKVSESVSKAVASQTTIISDLRDLSLARSGKLNLQLQAASLRELVDTVVRSSKNKAEARSLTLTFQKGDDPLLALCDPARVLRIIRHLIENAIMSTDQGAISVRLDRDGDFARLSVTDSGGGMPPDPLPGVFRTVDQPGTSPSQSNRRLGIGLALVPSLVEAHGGRMLVESDGVTRGTTFSVWLRLIQSLASASTTRAAQHNPLDGLRLVLVDDSVDLLTSFGALLGMEGATVETFDNAKGALTRLLQGNVDLLISDLGMPGMDGYQLIREVRKHPQLASLPAIALTGYGRTRDPAHAVKSGFNAHTTKPATVEELQNIVALLKPT